MTPIVQTEGVTPEVAQFSAGANRLGVGFVGQRYDFLANYRNRQRRNHDAGILRQ
jgi:hypothetical protein